MNKTKNKAPLVSVPETDLLALVASKLKNVVLFPEKLEKAKEYLDKVKMKPA